MSGVGTYDPGKLIFTFGGVYLSGFTDGDFLTVTQKSPAYTDEAGGDSEVIRTRSRDKRAEVKLRLWQTSRSNDDLTLFFANDQASPSGIILPLFIHCLSTGTKHIAPQAWIRMLPEAQYGVKGKEREWCFDCAQMNTVLKGNSL
jgi:hypothetical protein